MENFENEHIVEEDQSFSTNDPTSEIEIEEKDIFDMSIQNIEIDHIRDDQNSINGFQDMNDELIRCEICEKVFKNKIMLKNHFCIVHNNEGEIITCNICTKTFQTKIELKSHIKCEKGFHKGLRTNKFDSGLNTLEKHLFTVHDGHKDFKCGSCEKTFSHASTLKRHIHTIHKGHKDYKCATCGKKFSQVGNLKVHIHTVH